MFRYGWAWPLQGKPKILGRGIQTTSMTTSFFLWHPLCGRGFSMLIFFGKQFLIAWAWAFWKGRFFQPAPVCFLYIRWRLDAYHFSWAIHAHILALSVLLHASYIIRAIIGDIELIVPHWYTQVATTSVHSGLRIAMDQRDWNGDQ